MVRPQKRTNHRDTETQRRQEEAVLQTLFTLVFSVSLWLVPASILPLRQFVANRLQELLGQLDTVGLAVLAPLVLDTEVARILVLLHHDVEHLAVVGPRLVALVVELVALG